jgi:hypothetical protein
MVASIVVIVFSSALVLYWFRYTCILLVRNGVEEVRAASAAVQNSFSFGEVQKGLLANSELDPLHHSLQRDYRVLSYLVSHASGLELASWEERLLVWDYKLLSFWYAITRTAAPGQAREALSEMAAVLGILAGRIGQRAGVQSQA